MAHARPSHDPLPSTPHAVSMRMRARWMLLALLPGAALVAWFRRDPSPWEWLGAALLLVFCFAHYRAPAQRQRDLSPLLRFALVVLWLPPATPWWTFALAMFAIVAIEWLFADRPAANPFHPTMIACALVLVCLPVAPSASPSSGAVASSAWIALAWALGGIALLAARCIRWQAPLALLAGAAIVFAAWGATDPSLPADPVLRSLLPSLVLTAFFIADDPPRTGMQPRARLFCGFLAGGIATATMLDLHMLHRDGQLPLALAGTMLAMSAAAPTLDRLFASPRATMGASA
jgi:Na+-translocating ferredoxin:NAD+ oxidoreductase RnfD subunit